MDQSGDLVLLAGALPQALLEGVKGEVGAQRGRAAPADDPAGEHVHDEGDVDEPRPRGHVGQVGDPEPVRRGRLELAPDQVLGALLPAWDGSAGRAPAHGPTQAEVAHEPAHGAAGHRDALPVELAPHLVRAVDAEVLRVHSGYLRLELLVADQSRRGRASLRGVVGARRDLGPRSGEDPADRLDAELLAMLVDVVDQRVEGRSSSAAKKAEADFRIAFARRSSRTSRSNSAIRARSSVVVPGV